MNEITFSGRLVVITPAERKDKEFCYIKVAHDNGKNKDGEDLKDTIIDFEVWGKPANFLKQHCSVGEYVVLRGHFATSDYEKDGQRIYKTAHVIDKIERPYKKGTTQTTAPAPTKEEEVPQEGVDVSNDDLPF